MKFYPYIVCWDEVHDNVCGIESSFKELSQEYTIINSGSIVKDEWMNVGDIRYYRQLYTALKHFNQEYEFMAFICGDVSSSNWGKVLGRAQEVLSANNVGIYAPHLTNEPWHKESCYLDTVDEDLFLAAQTDGIMVFISTPIVRILIKYFEYLELHADLPSLTSGWGMDTIWSSISIYFNQPILRDNKYIVNHPAGSSYNHSKASEDLKIVLDNFNSFAKDFGFDYEKITFIESKTFGRMAHREDCMKPEDFYTLPLEIKKVNKLNYHIVSIDDSRKINKDTLRSKVVGTEINIDVLNAKIDGETEKFFAKHPEVKVTWPTLKAGEIGCFGSHYMAWRYLADSSDIDTLMIFEDDIIVHDGFMQQYNNTLNNIPKNWDIASIFVDPNQYDRYNESQKINYYIAKGYQDWSTLGYVISKQGAEKLCNFVKENGMNQPVDWYIFRNGHAGNFNVYTIPPYIGSKLEIDHTHSSLVQE